MTIKLYKLLGMTLMLFSPLLTKAVTVTDSAVAANVQVCLNPDYALGILIDKSRG